MNEAQFSVIAIANSSTGLPYFVLLAPNVYSHERDITNPSPENERNMKSLPSLASHEYFADMNNRIEAFGRDKLIISHEQASVEVVGNAIVTKAKLNCSEFIGEGDFMEMSTMGDHTYLALFFFTMFCLCCLSIFMTQCFPGKLVAKVTTGRHQDVKSEIFISMLLSITTVLLILGTGNSRSQLEGVHLTTTIFAVAANLPYKVSGKFYPYENHMDNKGYYDEPNDKNGRTDVKLRMLIPMKNTFHEFVKVELDPEGNGTTATGFAVDLFIEVMDSLHNRVSYEFVPYESTDSLEMGYYDQLILQLHLERYDGVVGDITITSDRSKSGDFTQPYMIAGYGAILQALLSPNNDGPIVTTIEQLIVNEDYVGYQKGSFVFDLLKHMGFREEKLKAYSSIDEYATALSRGSSYNGVSAIVDEIPYIKVFLAKYADRYTMVRPTFSTMGFAFLFQRGCTIVPDVSRTILEFIEGNKMTELEKKWAVSDSQHHPWLRGLRMANGERYQTVSLSFHGKGITLGI
ncbi:hypothetical protein AAC387_Pa04g0662 [Persea americana]